MPEYPNSPTPVMAPGYGVDSAGATDVELAAHAADAGTHTNLPYAPAYDLIAGRYYGPTAGPTGNVQYTQSTGYASPFVVRKAQAFDRIATNCTATRALSVVRLGIYTNSKGPAALVLDAGTVDCTAATGDKELTIAQTLNAGLYWLVAVPQGADANLLRDVSGLTSGITGAATPGGTGTGSGVVTATAGIAGALPGTYPALSATLASVPSVWLRAA